MNIEPRSVARARGAVYRASYYEDICLMWIGIVERWKPYPGQLCAPMLPREAAKNDAVRAGVSAEYEWARAVAALLAWGLS